MEKIISSKQATVKLAGEVARDPNLYNAWIALAGSKKRWECMGYSRTGFSVKFGRRVSVGRRLRQVTRYVSPNEPVTIIRES